MMQPIVTFLATQNRQASLTVGFVLVVLLGSLDFLSGYEINFSIFYLLPITWITWCAGKQWGGTVASISAFVWLGADIASGHGFSHPAIPFWNALTRLGFFFIVITLLHCLKLSYEEQMRVTRELSASIDSITSLSGLIPICAWCKKIRDDRGDWQQVEVYIAEHSEASFTPGICQECEVEQRQALSHPDG